MINEKSKLGLCRRYIKAKGFEVLIYPRKRRDAPTSIIHFRNTAFSLPVQLLCRYVKSHAVENRSPSFLILIGLDIL